MKIIDKVGEYFRVKNTKIIDSMEYWEKRYKAGGNSGSGSYNELALYKAEIINDTVSRYGLQTVVEFGVGDGNQLSLMQYEQYLGLDVSKTAIRTCIEKFKKDSKKNFMLYDTECFANSGSFLKSDIVLSLDVIYHLIEENVYKKYIEDIFSVGIKMVIIYSTNESLPQFGGHEKHRNFTKDIKKYVRGWELVEIIENKYSIEKYGEERGSRANFYLYTKR